MQKRGIEGGVDLGSTQVAIAAPEQSAELQELLATYSRSSDEELINLASEADSLKAVAWKALAATLRERKLEGAERLDALRERPPLLGVRGWLLFFVISWTVISPIVMLYLAFDAKSNLGIWSNLLCAVLGLIAGFALLFRRSRAMFWTSVYLWAIVIYGIASLFANTGGNASEVLGAAIWGRYFQASIRVKNTYGGNISKGAITF